MAKLGRDLFLSKAYSGCISINSSNIQSGILFRNVHVLSNSNNWHAIIIVNTNLDRNDILKQVLDYVYPSDLIPVNFQQSGNDAMFLARNCSDAISKICKENLVIPNTANPKNPFKCEIVLQYATLQTLKVDAQKNISSVLSSLYNHSTKALDLSRFHLNPDLTEYSPLMQPKILYFVLHLCNNLQATCLKLNNNEIKSLVPMEALWNTSNVTHLDLRNNLIDSISQLETLKLLKIKEIWLDGNPLCNNYDKCSYVSRIKEMLPNLEVLDGIRLYTNGLPSYQKNFLCDESGYTLVNEFIKHYFTLYDTSRQLLENIYSPNAMFSLTTCYKAGQNSSETAQLRTYQINARNLVTLADFSKSQTYLFRGHKIITKKLSELPQCEHDTYSFTTDLMYFNYEDKQAIISVSGAFRENPQSLLDVERVLGFTRVFFLNGDSNDEWTISNEMLHVFNILTSQEPSIFKVPIQRQSMYLPPASNEQEKLILHEAFESITGLNVEWRKKLLDDTGYNFKKALSNFVELYKDNRIPMTAFKNTHTKKEYNSLCSQTKLNEVNQWNTSSDSIEVVEFSPRNDIYRRGQCIKVDPELEAKLIKNPNWANWSPETKRKMLDLRAQRSRKNMKMNILLDGKPQIITIPKISTLFNLPNIAIFP